MASFAFDSSAYQTQLFINGEFVDAKSGEKFATINPATEARICDVQEAGAEDVDIAVAAARAALPAWRKLDTQARHGWLLPDLAHLPRHLVPRTPAHSHTRDAAPPRVLSVEIKPKSGVLPCATVVSPDKAIKATVSRFQMMQRTKMHQGKVAHLSGYDPLQLFSRTAAAHSIGNNGSFATCIALLSR